MTVIELAFWVVACHMIGDYVLQSDFIATTKGSNWYHLIVHSVLYCVPFAFLFKYMEYGMVYIIALLITHIIIDASKARYKAIDYLGDQVLHYLILFIIIMYQ